MFVGVRGQMLCADVTSGCLKQGLAVRLPPSRCAAFDSNADHTIDLLHPSMCRPCPLALPSVYTCRVHAAIYMPLTSVHMPCAAVHDRMLAFNSLHARSYEPHHVVACTHILTHCDMGMPVRDALMQHCEHA